MIPRYSCKGCDLTKKKKRLLFFLFLIAIVGVLLADSNVRLTTTRYEVGAQHLPDSFDGFTIVQLSDLHAAQFGEDNCRLVDAVRKLAPDLIALTGDYIEREADIPVTESLVGQLAEIAPVYFTSGNHDWASGAARQLKQAVNDAGGVYLSNEYLPLERDGQSIVLAGVEDPNGYADQITPDKLMEEVNTAYPGSYVVLLAHRNDFVTRYPDLQCDVVFTGHGHGGVIRLPGIGGLVGTDLHFFPEYDAGVFHSQRYDMVVSRGLGDAPLLPRFLNNPEIVAVTLRKK